MSNLYQAHYAKSVARNLDYWGSKIQRSTEQELLDLLPENENLLNAISEGLSYPSIYTELVQFALDCFPFVFVNDLGHYWESSYAAIIAKCPEEERRLRCELLIRLGQLRRISPDSQSTESAAACLSEALDIAEAIQDRLLVGRCYIHIAALLRRQHQLEKALILAQEALSIFPEGTKPQHLGTAHGLIGRLYQQQANYELAKRHLETAAQAFAEHDSVNELARTLLNLGHLALESGEINAAIDHLQQARAHLEATEDERLKNLAQLNLGVALTQQKLFADAETVFREINFVAFLQQDDFRNIAIAKQNLGNVLYLQGKLGEAAAFLHEALDAWEEIPPEPGRANTVGTLGQIKAAQGDIPAARKLLAQAVSLLSSFPEDAFARKLLDTFTEEGRHLPGPSLR